MSDKNASKNMSVNKTYFATRLVQCIMGMSLELQNMCRQMREPCSYKMLINMRRTLGSELNMYWNITNEIK